MSSLLTLVEIKNQIQELCRQKKQSSASVKILAVSKLQSNERINVLLNQGQLDFGENYVQEFKEKHDAFLEKSIQWHLIGHLQKNKVKTVVGRCHLIHSVDSVELAQEINKRAASASLRQKILLQVNVAGENSKEGFNPEVLRAEIKNIFLLPQVEILGLMTMPPFVENPEDNRVYFRNLRTLLKIFQSENGEHPSFCELSMGTSQDYQVAIEEGATWIRLGSTLFGPRL